MAKFNSKTIETLSVNAVRNSITVCPLLDEFVADNDKEPSWDGNIYIYDNKKKTKDTLKGRIPIQVKGKFANNFSNKEIKYSMNVIDLKNYLKDGGAILFVVYVNEKSESKIYYRELTPMRLNFLLNDIKGKKTKSVTLYEFPKDKSSKTTIFLNCLQNCRKQASFVDTKLESLEELEKKGLLEGITIPFSGIGINDPQEALLKNDVYLYAKIKGCNILQPIEIIPQERFTHHEIHKEITINNKVFYNSYFVTESLIETTIKLGDSFKIIITKGSNTCRIKYKDSSFMRILNRDLDFMLSFIENGYFQIEDTKFPFDENNADFSNFNIKDQRQRLDYIRRGVRVFDILKCNSDLDLSTLTDEQARNLFRLSVALLDNKPVYGLREDLPIITLFPIGNLNFLIVLQRDKSKERIEHMLFDFFDKDMQVGFTDENEQQILVSKYELLIDRNLLEISNLRTENFLIDFQKYQKDTNFERPIRFLLTLLNSYDLSNDKRKDLLNTSFNFATWIKNSAIETDYAINEINYLQVIKRMRSLNEDEQLCLWNIIENKTTNDMCKLGAYLLLDQHVQARRYFNKLKSNQKEEFTKYPIYRFWKTKENK